MQLLRRIDQKQYGAYKDLYGSSYNLTGQRGLSFSLEVVYVQGDPYAAPSRVVVRIPLAVCAFPAELYSSRIRTTALCDFLQRSFVASARRDKADVKEGGGGWGGAKGGQIRMDEPGQHVLNRTAVQISDGCLEARFLLGLPASGRSIEGKWCADLFFDIVPSLVSKSLLYSALDPAAVALHVKSVEDQDALRSMLEARGLVAFVRNGALLPRRSGASDLPMQASSSTRPFASPPSLLCSFDLPHSGTVHGMGIKKGVTLIVGGGFHGKSTLLGALEVGIYDHIPGDGREFVCINESAVKIRAEDGRNVTDLDISSFINNLPLGKQTASFSTPCASGSTSQSANIVASPPSSRMMLEVMSSPQLKMSPT
jgi:predicted ABC-class ATPase